jgi:phasin family protein
MITNPSEFLELQRVQVNTLNSVGHALISAAEKLSSLNVAAGRSAIDSATEAAQSLSGIKDAQDLLAVSGASAKPSVQQLVNYTRGLMAIANGVSTEISKVVQRQVAESNRRVAELLDYAARNAPAGSEQSLSLLRGALTAGNTAFETMTKVSKQTADWTEANLTAAAKAAGNAAGSTAKAAA